MGPMVMVALGGVFAEAFADTAQRLVPLGARRAGGMLEALRGKGFLDGFRGMPAVDKDALIAVIAAVADLMADHPEIAEIEINPLRVSATGAIALDALVHLDG